MNINNHSFLIVFCVIVLSGCTQLKPANDVTVATIINERIDKDVQWNRQGYCDEQLNSTIKFLVRDELTVDKAVQIALLNNPDIQATFEEIGIAHADLVEAGLFQNPIFDAFFRFPNRSSLSLNTEFAITQSFIDLFLVPLRKKIASAEFESVKLHVANKILEVSFDVQKSYYSLVAEQKRLKLTNSLKDVTEASYQLASNQKAAGNINDLELQSRLNEFLENKIALTQSSLEIIKLKEQLNKLLGLNSSNNSWTICHELSLPPAEKIIDSCLESIALSTRLDLEVARWKIEQIVRMGATKQWWAYSDLSVGFAGEKDPDGTWMRGPAISGSIPLFNYGQADRERLYAKYKQSLEQYRSLEISVLLGVRLARDQLLIQEELVSTYQNELIPLQEQIISMSQRFYNAMSLNVYKLLNAKKHEIEIQISATIALKNYWLARIELDRSLGGNLHLAVNASSHPIISSQSEISPVAQSDKLQKTESINPQSKVDQIQNLPYMPVVTPNGSTLPWKMKDGVKVFHLIAEPIQKEFAPGLMVNCCGYNGQSPGPTIEAVEGDRIRIYVTNKLPEATTVHWHGILLPNGMDGVTGLNQSPILPGETFRYEFTLRQSGTHMYHPHYDEMTEIGMGLMGLFIIHPKIPTEDEKVDRDFAIMLHEWAIPIGASTPNPMVMLDFNYFTFNGTVWPGTDPLVVKKGQKVRIRLGNLSMNSHPIHLHGYEFTVTAQGAKRMKPSAQYEAVTINVPVGDTRDIEFLADEPGDWALHCHKTHHTMNGMEHDIPNLIGVNQEEITDKIKKLLPQYMGMGSTGMGEMYEMHKHMKGPPNYLHHGSPGQFGIIEMAGMFTVLKVRDDITNYNDPGWYLNPPETVAGPDDHFK